MLAPAVVQNSSTLLKPQHPTSPHSRQRKKTQTHSRFRPRSNPLLNFPLCYLKLPAISKNSIISFFLYPTTLTPVKAVLEVDNDFLWLWLIPLIICHVLLSLGFFQKKILWKI